VLTVIVGVTFIAFSVKSMVDAVLEAALLVGGRVFGSVPR
jgi:hypothetical protein